MRKRRQAGWRALLLGMTLTLSGSAMAVDRVVVELGGGDNLRGVTRIGATWDWQSRWFADGGWYLGGYWEAELGRWWSTQDKPGHKDITEVGLTPVFRLQQTHQDGISPYAELGVGLHFLSNTRLNDQRKFGESFQFGDHIGFGVTFGQHQAFDIGYRFQHLSNAGLAGDNSGMNLHLLHLGYRLP